MEKRVSPAIIKRLPRYYTHLKELAADGATKISSQELGDKMGITASQVRQDLNSFGGFGQQGYGYPVEGLMNSIGSILKLDIEKTAVIVGIGNLGKAIMNNFRFAESGFKLIAAFDTDPALIGMRVHDVEVLSADKLREFCVANSPDVGVLTLPRQYAHETAAILCDCGIKGIWNFTNIDLHLEFDTVPVENVHFSESLMVLSYKLGQKPWTRNI